MCGEELDEASIGWHDGYGIVICDPCYEEELTNAEREEYFEG